MTLLFKPAGKSRGTAGLTLVEVLVAMVVTSIVLLVSLFAMRSGWLGTKRSIRQSDAALLIGEQVELMRYRIAKSPDNNFAALADSCAASTNGVTVCWQVEAGGYTDVKKVTFTASWGGGSGDASLVVPTYISKNY